MIDALRRPLVSTRHRQVVVRQSPYSEPPPRYQLAARRLAVDAIVGIVAVGGGAGLAVSLTQHTPAGTSATPGGPPALSIDPIFPSNNAGRTYGDQIRALRSTTTPTCCRFKRPTAQPTAGSATSIATFSTS
jgi:hypothetical protein